jgi:hypothetical protein
MSPAAACQVVQLGEAVFLKYPVSAFLCVLFM